jgi:hypothetical protein
MQNAKSKMTEQKIKILNASDHACGHDTRSIIWNQYQGCDAFDCSCILLQ